jgi:hypothetical protein
LTLYDVEIDERNIVRADIIKANRYQVMLLIYATNQVIRTLREQWPTQITLAGTAFNATKENVTKKETAPAIYREIRRTITTENTQKTSAPRTKSHIQSLDHDEEIEGLGGV